MLAFSCTSHGASIWVKYSIVLPLKRYQRECRHQLIKTHDKRLVMMQIREFLNINFTNSVLRANDLIAKISGGPIGLFVLFPKAPP